MKIIQKTLLGLLITLLFIGCSSDKEINENVEPSLVVGKSLKLSLKDQFDKAHTLDTTTSKVIFAFSKDMAHIVNDYLQTKEASYLADNNTQFVADVSSAPSIIKSMFILPGLKDFKHTVLLLNESEVAAPFKAEIDVKKIVIVYVNNASITNIETISTKDELIAKIEAK